MRFKVSIADSGKHFTAEPGESLLEAALFQDIALPYGCQSGGCGACRARLLAGDIAYPYDPPALSAADKAAGYVLLCQAQARSDLQVQVQELPEDHAIPVRNLPVRVEERTSLCHDVIQLRLRLPKGEVFEFLAGQYVDIQLRDGRRRSFSIANAPQQKGFIELHIRLVPGGEFSDFVNRSMQDRAILRIEGPLGGFYLRPSERPLLLMAGGTGLAPVKAMIDSLAASGRDRRTHLFWGVRARRDLYMHEALQTLAQSHDWLRYTAVLSAPAAEDGWRGECGWVHEALLAAYPELAAYDVYMSGPPVMIDAGRQAFLSRDLPEEQLYHDAFDYAFRTWPERESAG